MPPSHNEDSSPSLPAEEHSDEDNGPLNVGTAFPRQSMTSIKKQEEQNASESEGENLNDDDDDDEDDNADEEDSDSDSDSELQ